MKSEQLDITPTVGMLALLKNLDYNEWYALAEFVDNAIQSYIENKQYIIEKTNFSWRMNLHVGVA